MKVLITGTSRGIGKAIAIKFLENNHQVIGFDINESTINHINYTHYKLDIFHSELPNIENVEILINNAGVQNSQSDIDINLKGTIRLNEKYAFQSAIKSVLFVASASASSGSEFPEYAASKGGIISYMKNVALRLAKYNATSNSISPGGVLTESNDHIIKNKKLWKEVMDETLLEKWADVKEISEWAYFITIINKSMTAQDILIDNGEMAKANFIW